MAVSNTHLEQAQTRHAVFLQRRYSGIAADINPFLNQAQKAVRDALFIADGQIANKRELDKIIRLIEKRVGAIYRDWNKKQNQALLDLAIQEALFQHKIHLSETKRKELRTTLFNEVSGEEAFESAQSEPIVLDGKATTMERVQEAWTKNEIERITDSVRGGFQNGLAVAAIYAFIKGTKAKKYRDGQLAITKRHSDSLVRTQGNHVSQLAKDFYFSKQRVIVGYKILATLDFRTTTICKHHDGQEVLKTDMTQPRPPFHHGCRTVTTAIFADGSGLESDGDLRTARGPNGGTTVSAKLTYYEWLKRQPASFQDKALGPTRGKIFRNSGLTTEEFRQASVNRFNEPLTLAEMRQEDELISKYLEKGE